MKQQIEEKKEEVSEGGRNKMSRKEVWREKKRRRRWETDRTPMRALPPLVPSASFHLSPGWVGDESLSKQMGPCENTALICNRRQSKIFYVKAQWRHLGRLSQLRQKLLLSLFFSIFFPV